ncbi:MAG: hypothetical protein L3J24_10435 [Xanthomonadales bacterium]|nr:hypothetical protein [Xanthomonadales bacterium]
MVTIMNNRLKLDEILENIDYINRKAQIEIESVQVELQNLISGASLAGEASTVLLSEVSSRLGQLTTRVVLVEASVKSIKSQYKPGLRQKLALQTVVKSNQQSAFTVPVSQLPENTNLLPLEVSEGNISYCWTGDNPETEFSFSLNRGEVLGFKLCLFALIKPEYAKRLKIIVDGRHLKHWINIEDKLYILNCDIPVTTTTGLTSIAIVIPSTHSPKDLGTSGDERKLGIAISEIRFGRPGSKVDNFLKRLKLKP